MPRSSLLLLLAFPLVAGPAAAQTFEGTITMTITSTSGGQSKVGTMKTATRGDRTVTTVKMGAGAGAMVGAEVATIIDRKAKTVTTLTPLPPGMKIPPAMKGAKGLMSVQPLSSTPGRGTGPDTHPDIKKLGTSQTIAGMRCDDYEIREGISAPIRACITTALGTLASPWSGQGMMGGGGSASPGWARAFGGKPGFPLKVWSLDGNVAMLVTAIDKTPVPDRFFAIPAGFVMMKGRGG